MNISDKIKERELLLNAYKLIEVDSIPITHFAKIIGVSEPTIKKRYGHLIKIGESGTQVIPIRSAISKIADDP